MVVTRKEDSCSNYRFFEASIYVTALSKVVGNLDNPGNSISLCIRLCSCNYIGITIENRIAFREFGSPSNS